MKTKTQSVTQKSDITKIIAIVVSVLILTPLCLILYNRPTQNIEHSLLTIQILAAVTLTTIWITIHTVLQEELKKTDEPDITQKVLTWASPIIITLAYAGFILVTALGTHQKKSNETYQMSEEISQLLPKEKTEEYKNILETGNIHEYTKFIKQEVIHDCNNINDQEEEILKFLIKITKKPHKYELTSKGIDSKPTVNNLLHQKKLTNMCVKLENI